MFVPLSVCVMYLSSRLPEEGGLYVWSKAAFGPFAGFITGWTYWCSNLPYFPALLYFTAGNALFIAGESGKHLAGSPAYYIAVSLAGFTIATVVNVLGWDVGKWLNNAGAAGRWIVTLILILLGALAWRQFGSATPFTLESMRPGLALKDVIFWSVIAFAWVGPEVIPFMAGEIKDPRRTIPRGLALAAPAIAAIYVLGTAALLTALPAGRVSNLYGVMQAVENVSARLGIPALAPIAAVLMTVSCLGSVGIWLGAVARIPFVAGIDRYLPEAFGRMHPRWNSPVVALLTQAAVSAVFIIAGQGGTTVKGAYDVMVSATVLITMVPFLFLFAAAMKLRGHAGIVLAALVGFATTLGAMVLAAFPADDEPHKTLAVVKVVGLTIAVLFAGAAFYFYRKRTAFASDGSKALV